jgi:hypothetical protein
MLQEHARPGMYRVNPLPLSNMGSLHVLNYTLPLTYTYTQKSMQMRMPLQPQAYGTAVCNQGQWV